MTLLFTVNVPGKKLYCGHICGPFIFNRTDDCVFQKKYIRYLVLVKCAIVCSSVYLMKNKIVQVLRNKVQITATSDDADYMKTLFFLIVC